jgi:hypothetical protein
MSDKNNSPLIREKIFLFIEVFFIIIFFSCTIFELLSIFKMYSIYINSQSFYYFYLIHNRLQLGAYNSFIKAGAPNAGCPSYPNRNQSLQLSYVPRRILTLGSIENAALVDVSVTTQVYESWSPLDPPADRVIQNNTIARKKYYEFDIQNKGNSKIELMTNYIFDVWRGINMCVLKMEYEPKAYVIIPKDDTISNTDWTSQDLQCKKITGDNTAQTCGYYFNTYQTCSLLTYTKINSSLRVTDFDYNKLTKDWSWSCPFNYFDMNLTYSEYYNETDINSLEVNGTEYSQFNNYVEEKYKASQKYEKYFSMIDKYFVFDLDNAFIGQYQNISSATDSWDYLDYDPTVYKIGEPYGFKDSFMGIWDTYPLESFYNDTFFQYSVKNPKTKITTYLPEFLSGSDDFTYYIPVDNVQSPPLNISLTYSGLPTITKECFVNYIQPNQKWQWFLYLDKMQTSFLDDNLPLILAWLFVKLFISLFWQFSIRFKLIYEKFKTGKNFPADIKSDYITRYTSKAVCIIVFALLFYGVIYQKNYFFNLIDFSDNMIKYNCYSDSLINDSIIAYKKYVESLDSNNNNILISLMISLSVEILSLLLYFIDHYLYKKAQNKANDNFDKENKKKTL